MPKLPEFKYNPKLQVIESPLFLNEAIEQMELPEFSLKVFQTFSDQVTSVCTKTGASLFDIEKAKIIRNQLDKVFTAILETIDEEIVEYYDQNLIKTN